MSSMTNFDKPVDIAWRKLRALLKSSGDLTENEMSMAQEMFKAGYNEGQSAVNCEELYG